MYGLVNQSVKHMIMDNYGEDKWEQVLQKIDHDGVFVAMDQYPDELTGEIIGAACEVLNADGGKLLQQVGNYWIEFAANPYKEMFDMSGNAFVEFVKNLNDLHTRVGQIMHDLQPPSFFVTEETEDSFKLHYHSVRPGIWPMVVGLMEGLGERFDTKVEVEHIADISSWLVGNTASMKLKHDSMQSTVAAISLALDAGRQFTRFPALEQFECFCGF